MIVANDKCIGCGNCNNNCPQKAIEMVYLDGFLYPKVNKNLCNNCGVCEKKCLVNKDCVDDIGKGEYYAVYETPHFMKNETASGGISDALARTIIEMNGVVYGVECCHEQQNWKIEYIRIEKISDLSRICGTKYAQADATKIHPLIIDDLRNNRNVLFIGTPCQVAAMKLFLPAVYHDRLFLVDIFCHGTPSAQIVCDYLKYLEFEKYRKRIINYNFRSKKPNGWGHKLRVEIGFEDGTSKNYRAAFCPLHNWFGKHLSLRKSCYDCQFRKDERCSDITVGDFWDIEKFYPNIPRKQGVSAVVVSTEKGKKLFKSIDDQYINLYQVSKDSVLGNRYKNSTQYSIPISREQFINDYLSGGVNKLLKDYPPVSVTSLAREKIRHELSKLLKL